jgi:hypothetical protein
MKRFIAEVGMRLRRSVATFSSSGKTFSIPLPVCAEMKTMGA